MRGGREFTITVAATAILVATFATCTRVPRMPAVDGAVVEVRRSDGLLGSGDRGYDATLQLSWFGTACHLIQLGDARVLTDPFVTNRLRLAGMRSDPARVAETLGRVRPPDMVLVNHSHHDHILDAYAAMAQRSWRARKVPLYGGRSCKNLLAGWGDAEVDGRCHAVPDAGGRLPVSRPAPGYTIKVTAYRSKHGPHLKCGFTLADGMITRPRRSAPRGILAFQAGEVFNYLVELSSPSASLNVFCLGAPFDLDKLEDSMPPAGTPIDVAIILAPTADKVRGYPEEHIARLRPRHIVLSHFNTFFREDPDEQLAVAGIDFVKMRELSRDLQSTFAGDAGYPEFEKLHIPAITVMGEAGGARNVIRIR